MKSLCLAILTGIMCTARTMKQDPVTRQVIPLVAESDDLDPREITIKTAL